MPSKRKVALSPEPNPLAKRRAARPAAIAAASAIKRPRESAVATEEKIRRARKDEAAPSSVPSATTSRARGVIHKEIADSEELVVLHYDPPSESKIGRDSTTGSVQSSKTPIKAPSNPKAALKSGTR